MVQRHLDFWYLTQAALLFASLFFFVLRLKSDVFGHSVPLKKTIQNDLFFDAVHFLHASVQIVVPQSKRFRRSQMMSSRPASLVTVYVVFYCFTR